MAIPLSPASILEVSIDQRLFGQRVLNILHYQVRNDPGTTLDYTSWMTAFLSVLAANNNLIPKMVAATSTSLFFSSIRVQPIRPIRLPFVVEPIGTFGADPSLSPAPNLAASITKRGVTGGKHGIGRMQVAGVPGNVIVGGRISDAAYQTALANLGAQIRTTVPVTVTTTTLEMVPVLFDRNAPEGVVEIFQTVPQDTVRTMHRRTVGLGE